MVCSEKLIGTQGKMLVLVRCANKFLQELLQWQQEQEHHQPCATLCATLPKIFQSLSIDCLQCIRKIECDLLLILSINEIGRNILECLKFRLQQQHQRMAIFWPVFGWQCFLNIQNRFKSRMNDWQLLGKCVSSLCKFVKVKFNAHRNAICTRRFAFSRILRFTNLYNLTLFVCALSLSLGSILGICWLVPGFSLCNFLALKCFKLGFGCTILKFGYVQMLY